MDINIDTNNIIEQIEEFNKLNKKVNTIKNKLSKSTKGSERVEFLDELEVRKEKMNRI